MPVADGPPAKLRIWDFGGQDIYHGTHALFLKSRAIFPIIWTPSSEDVDEHVHDGFTFRNQPLGYWLAYVHEVGDEHKPVLIIQSQCDEPETEKKKLPSSVSDEQLEQFPYCDVLHYSAKTDRKRGALNDALADAVRWLRKKQGTAVIGSGRAKVKERLEALYAAGTQTLSQHEYHALCEEVRGEGHIITSESLLLEYLHNIGTVFYRKDLFGDAIILDQRRALNAVYAVFERKSRAFKYIERFGGRFRRSDLEEWVWDKFGKAEQALSISFMEQCGICFKAREGDANKGIEAEYIAPDLLPGRDDPEMGARILRSWSGASDASRSRSYDLLPPGLMRSLISGIGAKAGLDADYWREGFLFFERETGSKALVEQKQTERWAGRIDVQTRGGQAERLLDRVLKFIDESHEKHGARPAMRSREREPELRPDDIEMREVKRPDRPVFDIGAKKRTEPLYYVSYKRKDETPEGQASEAVADGLCTAADARGIRIMRDIHDLLTGTRITDFMKDLGSSDRIFMVLSEGYFYVALLHVRALRGLAQLQAGSGGVPEADTDLCRRSGGTAFR